MEFCQGNCGSSLVEFDIVRRRVFCVFSVNSVVIKMIFGVRWHHL